VVRELQHRIPFTLQLTVLAAGLALLIAVPLGIVSALHRNKIIDQAWGARRSASSAATCSPTSSAPSSCSEGRTYLSRAPNMMFFPGMAIFLMVLGFNLLGDGLRDALDPRTRGDRR